MVKKILYLSYDGLTDPLGQSQILPYLKSLSDNREIHVISFEKKETLIKYQKDVIDYIGDFNIYWHPMKYRKFPPVLSSVFDLYRMYRKSLKIQKNKNFSLVHCRSHMCAIVGHYIKKKINIPYIFDMRSFFPEERVDARLWPQESLIYRYVFSYFKKAEKEILDTADHIIVLTEQAKKIINIDAYRISVIPCCADFDYFDYNKISEESTKLAKKKLGINEDSFVLTYLGSLGTWYMLEEMFDFFKILKINKPNSVFLFLTPTEPNFILEIAKQKDIDLQDIYIKFAPRKELPTLLSISSVSIFFIINTFSKKASSPTKFAELMGLGIPVISNSGVGDIDQIILNTNAGKIINIDEKNPYEDSCIKIDEIININKKMIRKKGIELFSLSVGVKSYQEIYLKLESSI